MAREFVVARVSDLAERGMREVAAGDVPVLLVRFEGEVYSFGAKCTHRGGPLAEGVLSEDRIVCPWHQGCFRVPSGDLEEPPPLDALPCFETRVEGERVVVVLPEEPEQARQLPMASWNPAADGRTFVILGSGAAGSAAAEALREDGYEGRLVMVTRDAHLPYDRTALSKGYLKGMDPAGALLPLRSQTFYETHDIDVVLGRSITQVDTFGKQVTFDKEPPLAYDALLIATGSRPRQLGIPGEQLSNVFTLRSLDDANRIIAAAKPAAHAVVVGSSFIGMEAAANLAERGLGVTVVAPVIPFAKIFGAEIGRFFQRIHEERGVTFRLGTTVSRFEGDGEVRCAVLQNGMRVGCDLAVTGVGVDPATGMLGGVALNPDGSLSVDEHFRVREGLYAAGDVARFADWRTGKWLRIEHWRTAQQQGRIAAHNMAGKSSVFRGIPFFWTAQFGLFAQYVGHAAEWDEVIVQGDLSSKEFIAFYTAGDRVLAALGCTRSAELGALGELMRTNRMPSAGKLRKEEIDWIARLRDETDHCCRNGRGA